MPLSTYSSPLGTKGAAHLLRRATFGPTKQQIIDFSGLTPAAAVAQLFAGAADPALPINPDTGLEWVSTNTSAKFIDLETYFIGWHISQMLNPSPAYSTREKITFFLHTHFTTIKSKVSSPRALYFQNALFRKFALDGTDPKLNIKELAKKISVDNAMIRLLDCELNVKGNPNENYARELLELYTIGKGLDGYIAPIVTPGDYENYSELDVQVAARVLSGWDFDESFANIDPDTNLPRAKVKGSSTNASSHDNTALPKTFSNHFNSTTIEADPSLLNGGNPTEASALDEIDQLIEMIFAQPETARNICRKIYRFYCNREINDVLDADIIQAMANILISNNFKIEPVIRALLTSTHFYFGSSGVTDDTFGSIIKSPLDLATGVLRMFEYQLPSDVTALYDQMNFIYEQVFKMSMQLYEPVDVAGYNAYHQWPVYHRAWITPNSLALRYKFVESLFLTSNPEKININPYDWIKNNISDAIAASATNLAPELAKYLYTVPEAEGSPGLTDARYNYFRLKLVGGFDDAYWANLWNTAGADELRLALTPLFNAMLQSPEYQLE